MVKNGGDTLNNGTLKVVQDEEDDDAEDDENSVVFNMER